MKASDTCTYVKNCARVPLIQVYNTYPFINKKKKWRMKQEGNSLPSFGKRSEHMEV